MSQWRPPPPDFDKRPRWETIVLVAGLLVIGICITFAADYAFRFLGI